MSMGIDRRRFLQLAAAGLVAAPALAHAGKKAAKPKAPPPPKGKGGDKVPEWQALGRPDRNPYKHTNVEAKLPAWDGSNSSESKPGSMRMFRGNLTHTYYGSGTVPENPKLLWKFRMADFATLKHGEPITWRGTGWSGQTLKYGDYVFVGSTGGHFHCFEALTGKLVWVFAADRMFKGSPCFYKNRIYVPNVDNHLRCLDAATGKIVWDWVGPSDMDSSPCVLDGKVYVGGEDGKFKCFDAETGKMLFHTDFGIGEGETPGSGGIESSVGIAEGRAYFGHLDGHVRACNISDGKLVWKSKIGGDTDASPLLIDDKLYIGCEEGDKTFHCLAREDGKIVWSIKIPTGGW